MQIDKRLYNFYIIFSLSGFLISGILPSIFNIEEGGINILYRITVLFLSIFIIFRRLLSTNFNYELLKQYKLFSIFWFFYSLFLLNDLFLNPVTLSPGRTYF